MLDVEIREYASTIIRELAEIRELLSNIYKSQNRDPMQDLADELMRRKESEETSRSIFDGPRRSIPAPPK